MKQSGIATVLSLIIVLLMISPAMAQAPAKYIIGVDGLSCPFCAFGIEKRLKKVENVASISIDMNNGKVTVVAKPNTAIKEQDLRDAVDKAGFKVRSLEKVDGDREKPSNPGQGRQR